MVPNHLPADEPVPHAATSFPHFLTVQQVGPCPPAPTSFALYPYYSRHHRTAPEWEKLGRSSGSKLARQACTSRALQRTTSSCPKPGYVSPVTPRRSCAAASTACTTHLEIISVKAPKVVGQVSLEAARDKAAACISSRPAHEHANLASGVVYSNAQDVHDMIASSWAVHSPPSSHIVHITIDSDVDRSFGVGAVVFA